MSQLLRIATAGSVDDGKSTLIGRLLHDSKAIFEDQLAALERVSREQGGDYPNLALLTDGLRAERQQGITIDVAYRYFATPERKFILADTPGHVQYTRNMVTGASTADVALILVDARKGMTEQSRRHAFIAGLLGIAHFVVCVNKMDLVDWSERRFAEIRREFRGFTAKQDVRDVVFVPISALYGDNVVHRSPNMPWFDGVPLLHHLEQVHIASDRNLIDARLPVQYVIRDHHYRGYAGTVCGGVFRPGDRIVVLPSGFGTTVRAIWGPGGAPVTEAFPPQAVTVELADELDVGRGDLICRPNNRPRVSRDVDAMLCWLTERSSLAAGGTYTVLHATTATGAQVERIDYRLDMNTLHRQESARRLSLNDVGRVRLRTQRPLMFDPYHRNRETGSFILVDKATGDTVAAGLINGEAQLPTEATIEPTAGTPGTPVADRPSKGLTVWLTGLSGAGKTTVGGELTRLLSETGRPAHLLDGDALRRGLNADLGFGPADRAENVRRVGEVAQLFADAGMVAVVTLISPYRADRERVRQAHQAAGLGFVEVFVDTPIEVCRSRDPKRLYAQAQAGELTDLTGVGAPYEAPDRPDVTLRPADGGPAAMAHQVFERVLAELAE